MNPWIRTGMIAWYLVGALFYLGWTIPGLVAGKPVDVGVTLGVPAAAVLGVVVFLTLGRRWDFPRTLSIPGLRTLPLFQWSFSSPPPGLDHPLVEYRQRGGVVAVVIFSAVLALGLGFGVAAVVLFLKAVTGLFLLVFAVSPPLILGLVHGRSFLVQADETGFLCRSLAGWSRVAWGDVGPINYETLRQRQISSGPLRNVPSMASYETTTSLVFRDHDGVALLSFGSSRKPDPGADLFLELAKAQTHHDVGRTTTTIKDNFLNW
jgi:hypothetical protein